MWISVITGWTLKSVELIRNYADTTGPHSTIHFGHLDSLQQALDATSVARSTYCQLSSQNLVQSVSEQVHSGHCDLTVTTGTLSNPAATLASLRLELLDAQGDQSWSAASVATVGIAVWMPSGGCLYICTWSGRITATSPHSWLQIRKNLTSCGPTESRKKPQRIPGCFLRHPMHESCIGGKIDARIWYILFVKVTKWILGTKNLRKFSTIVSRKIWLHDFKNLKKIVKWIVQGGKNDARFTIVRWQSHKLAKSAATLS